MGSGFRIEIDRPANQVQTVAKTISWGADAGVVMRVGCDLQADQQRLSVLTVLVADSGGLIFGDLPDPAFQSVPVRFYMARASSEAPVLVFDGKITRLSYGYPSAQTTTIVAHDKSVDMRKRALATVIKGAKSTQIAEKIGKSYGLTVTSEVSAAVAAALVARSISYAAHLSEWDHIVRELAADGLEAVVTGSKLVIRERASTAYATTFSKGRPPIVTLDVTIEHIGTPGGGGDKTIAFQDKNTARVAIDKKAQQAVLAIEDADALVSRVAVTGPAAATAGAHVEDRSKQNRQQAPALQRRKDVLNMTCSALPDLTLSHTIALDGFGGKVDGTWYPRTISHTVRSGSEASGTRISATRAPSPGASKQAGTSSGAFAS